MNAEGTILNNANPRCISVLFFIHGGFNQREIINKVSKNTILLYEKRV